MKRSPLSRGSKPLKRKKALKGKIDTSWAKAQIPRLRAAGVTEIDPTLPVSHHVDVFAYEPLKASGSKLARSPIAKVGKRGRAILAQLRKAKAQVRARSGGWCEVKGCHRAADDYHHVQRRSRGGEHTPENLVAICRACHDREHFG